MRNLLLSSLLLVGSLQATTVVKLDFAQLSRMATNVVAGTIVSVTPEVDADTGYIYSNVEIALSKSAANNFLPGSFTFRMVGGEIGTKRLYIAGMPRFQQGEEVVLFLAAQTRAAITPTVGLWQGIFYVERDTATGGTAIVDHQHRPLTAVRNGRLIRGVKDDAAASTRSLNRSASEALSVDQFFQEVRRYRTEGKLAVSR